MLLLFCLPRHLTSSVFAALCMWQVMHCMLGADGRQNNRGAFHYRNVAQQRFSIDVKDKILELQCYAKCERPSTAKHVTDLSSCREQCRHEVTKYPKRGYCPSLQNSVFQHISPVQKLPCLDNCVHDFDCPEVQKCCESACGPICMDAKGVREDALLPPIPKVLNFKLPRGHKVEITIQSTANSTYYCHVETRYHIGLSFSPRKLGMWQWQPVEKIAEISDTKTKRTDIAFNIKPGRWYQVRVAAINAYGFRGYSEPSKAFTLSNLPKPPKCPTDLKVTASRFDGSYYTIKVVWCPSKSNLPIEKYKIIWSLYIKSKDESLISNEAYVKDAHQYEIKNLLPESSYYIQVQAISISGSRRLKSDKIPLLYNTTKQNEPQEPLRCAQQVYRDEYIRSNNKNDGSENRNNYTNSTDKVYNNSNTAASKQNDYNNITTTETSLPKLAPYEVRFRLNRKFGMIVQITGFHPHKEKVYELCPKDTNCEQREYSAIRAKKDSLEFSKLKYNTTYMLKAYRSNVSDSTGTYTFTTPKCENFRKRFPRMQINC